MSQIIYWEAERSSSDENDISFEVNLKLKSSVKDIWLLYWHTTVP